MSNLLTPKAWDWATDQFTDLSDRDRMLLLYRLSGKTMEEIGECLHLTRERVRQVLKKIFEKMPPVYEDDFLYWHDRYPLSKENFTEIFHLEDVSFYYLETAFGRKKKVSGKENEQELIKAMLSDEKLKEPYKSRCEGLLKGIRKYPNGEYVPEKKSDVVVWLLKTRHQNQPVFLRQLYQEYLDFCKENGLDSSLTEDQKGTLIRNIYVITQRDAIKDVLSLYGRKMRFRPWNQEETKQIICRLNLAAYGNACLTTHQLYEAHKKYLLQHDLRDGFELHNFLKKNKEFLPKGIKMNRSPYVTIGKCSRREHFERFVSTHRNQSLYGTSKEYAKTYGVPIGSFYAGLYYWGQK